MFNGVSIGYESGFKDAMNGLPAQPNKRMPALKAIVSEKYVLTFLQGYKQGYREGTWELNKKKRAELKTPKRKDQEQKQSTLSKLIRSYKEKLIGAKKVEKNRSSKKELKS